MLNNFLQVVLIKHVSQVPSIIIQEYQKKLAEGTIGNTYCGGDLCLVALTKISYIGLKMLCRSVETGEINRNIRIQNVQYWTQHRVYYKYLLLSCIYVIKYDKNVYLTDTIKSQVPQSILQQRRTDLAENLGLIKDLGSWLEELDLETRGLRADMWLSQPDYSLYQQVYRHSFNQESSAFCLEILHIIHVMPPVFLVTISMFW